MAGQVMKVKRETLEACMTCPLCDKLLREATTISLCLHTFCRKCIYERLSDEEVDSCPVCNIDLGCLPVEKLRPDHNLQDIRSKIFPLKRRKVNAPEITPLIVVPAKRKERSLSSLVVNTPKVPSQTGLTGRRTKTSGRRAAKTEHSSDDHSLTSSSPESHKSFRHKFQDSSAAEASSGQKGNIDIDAVEGKADLWTPLNCLVEAANRTKTSKSHSHTQGLGVVAKSEPSGLHISEGRSEADSLKERKQEQQHAKAKLNGNGSSVPIKRRRLRKVNRNRAVGLENGSTSAQVATDTSGVTRSKRDSPIWFSLAASQDGKGDIPLPQISASYLRIKDGKMPVSFIQKYIVQKLELNSESEIEIMCRGQPVLPTLQLQNLVDLWFRTGSTAKKVPASVGSSAKDFVMALSYSRKASQSYRLVL